MPRLFNLTMRVREWKGSLVFLHEVAPGAADRSYGIQVARLAGLPAAVVKRARAVLAELEATKAAGRVDALPLFSYEPPSPEPPPELGSRGAGQDRSGRAFAARGAGRAL